MYNHETVKLTKQTRTFTPKSFTGFGQSINPINTFLSKFTHSFCKPEHLNTMETLCTIMKWSSIKNKHVLLLPNILQDLLKASMLSINS